MLSLAPLLLRAVAVLRLGLAFPAAVLPRLGPITIHPSLVLGPVLPARLLILTRRAGAMSASSLRRRRHGRPSHPHRRGAGSAAGPGEDLCAASGSAYLGAARDAVEPGWPSVSGSGGL